MDYYAKTLFIPQVDENDAVTGKVERWEAHRKGILHRGFTVGILYDGAMICQHRKHPVFDGFLDLTASSHPLVHADMAEDTETAVLNCLKREWDMKPSDLTAGLVLAGKVVYYSKHSDYIEHEVCHLYTGTARRMPAFNPDFAYGYSLVPVEQLNDPERNPVLRGLAPWVKEMVSKDLLRTLLG
ncbi:MAG: hypothetical protein N2691_04850 [Patescibacteria group bacterium]|nr:hypothetical protein [Patescibacteria group bacterium]